MPDCIKQKIKLELLKCGSYNGTGRRESLGWETLSVEVVAQEEGGDGGNSRVPRRLIYAGYDWGRLRL